jgi:hydrogenase nickel incorporation protein HypA/HybF
MHELSITQNLLDLALRHADGKTVTDLHLVIGQLSSFMDDSVQFYWDIIAKGTPAEGARLHFRRIAAELKCRDCGQQFDLEGDSFACPTCNSMNVEVVGGDAFLLESIEVETESTKEAQFERDDTGS